MKVSTEVLIARLKEVQPEGFEVSIRFGMSSVTRAVYLRKDLFYLCYAHCFSRVLPSLRIWSFFQALFMAFMDNNLFMAK
jgi:hypothetical protein